MHETITAVQRLKTSHESQVAAKRYTEEVSTPGIHLSNIVDPLIVRLVEGKHSKYCIWQKTGHKVRRARRLNWQFHHLHIFKLLRCIGR